VKVRRGQGIGPIRGLELTYARGRLNVSFSPDVYRGQQVRRNEDDGSNHAAQTESKMLFFPSGGTRQIAAPPYSV